MNARQERGLVIAAISRLVKKGGVWIVPSQTGHGKYTVCPDRENPHCSCPDHEMTGGKCKHIFAVEFAMKREEHPDGSVTTTQSLTITETKKCTYSQNWPAYNKAQTNEKEQFRVMLRDLCAGIEEAPQGMGRPRIALSDSIFSAVYKVYNTFSGRRFMTDLREAKTAGFINRVPSYNSIFNCLDSESVTPLLHALITQTSLPLKSVEVDFAVDSSGFTSSRFVKWFDHKYGVVREKHTWVKTHLMCGVKTNIVTAVEIHGKDASDTKLLPPMVDATAKNFTLNEVSADKGYGSLSNYASIAAQGATPFIAFKSIHTGKGGGLWEQMFHYFSFRRNDFLQHYHKRSNVESTFSMIKAKYRDHVRSKTDTAMKNEVLCKIVCHNICVLIQEMHELGIEPTFWAEQTNAQKVS